MTHFSYLPLSLLASSSISVSPALSLYIFLLTVFTSMCLSAFPFLPIYLPTPIPAISPFLVSPISSFLPTSFLLSFLLTLLFCLFSLFLVSRQRNDELSASICSSGIIISSAKIAVHIKRNAIYHPMWFQWQHDNSHYRNRYLATSNRKYYHVVLKATYSNK